MKWSGSGDWTLLYTSALYKLADQLVSSMDIIEKVYVGGHLINHIILYIPHYNNNIAMVYLQKKRPFAYLTIIKKNNLKFILIKLVYI